MNDNLLTSTEVMARTGVTFRVLDYWARIGVLDPTRPARGSGSQRGYDESQITTIGVLDRLRRLGADRYVLAATARFLERTDERGELLVIDAEGNVGFGIDWVGTAAYVVAIPAPLRARMAS